MTNTSANDKLVMAYADYESQIISKHELLDAVQDFYYQQTVGMSYDEWVKNQ